jgi:glycosyltransferase involved in cell wall biosynthesis
VTTARRLATHLGQLGVAVQVLPTQPLPQDADDLIQGFRPQIVHALHAVKAGTIARPIAQSLGVPFIVTLTGTDVHGDFQDAQKRPAMAAVLRDAAAIVTFTPEVASEVREALPEVAGKIFVIPQGVWLPPQEVWDVRKQLGLAKETPLLLLPANIRKVKRPSLAIEGVAKGRRLGVDAHLLLAGAILETDEWQRVEEALKQHAWLHFLGAVPSERMGSVYEAADIVLNTSLHEGGMANALLEAMWLKRPVLASAVMGNTSLVRHEETGLLFRDADELAQQAHRLLTDKALRQRLIDNAFVWVRQHCDPMKEAQRYREVYAQALQRGG